MINPLHFFKMILTVLFGQIKWNKPSWIKYLSRHKILSGFIIIIALILLAVSYQAYRWYQRMPKPEIITAQIIPPAIMPIGDIHPQPLKLQFGVQKKESFEQRSVAALNLLGKEVTKGISIEPMIKGHWWLTENELTFYPDEEWLADQQYHIHCEPSLFASQAMPSLLKYQFKTQALTATISELKFYQDPRDSRIQQVLGSIEFNFPVDTQSVHDNLHLLNQQLQKGFLKDKAKSYSYTIHFDEQKRMVYIQSEPIKLLEKPYYLILNLDKGVKALSGNAKTQKPVSKSVLIPDTKNVVRIQKVEASIIRNEQDQPEQVLMIESSVGIKTSDMQQAIEVYKLPELPNHQEWLNPGQIKRESLTPAMKVNIQPIPSEHEYTNLQSFKIKAPAQQQLLVIIKKGLMAYGGYSLSNEYKIILKVPEFPSEINFLHKGALLALNNEKKLSVLVRGIPAVKFEVAKIMPHAINHLITQTRGDFSHPEFINQYAFNEKNISQITTEMVSFNQNRLDKIQYTALDLTHYLSKNQQGLFLIKAKAWNDKENYALDKEAHRLILITDIGMIVKDNADGSHDVFIQSITQGKPLANVKVAVLGINGEPIQTQVTNAQGYAHFTNLNDFKEEQKPIVYIAHKEQDLSFIPYLREDRQLNYSRFDIGGEYTALAEKQLTAFLFTDRGIYRPGDMLHLGMMVKQAYAKVAPQGIPVEAVITDPRGTIVYKQRYNLPDSGYLNLDYKMNETALTGQYNIDLYMVSKDNYSSNILGSTTIAVEEFLPDRLRIRTQLLPSINKGWVNPRDLKAKVELWNLFGTPAIERRVTSKIMLKPRAFHFKQYPDYIFIDPLLDPKKPPKLITEDLMDKTTNQQGNVEFELDLSRFGQSTYELNFFAEGFEAEGGRGVAGESRILVSPLTYLMGYKSDGDLNYIKQNDLRKIHFIGINSNLQSIKLTQLHARILQLHPVSSLVKKPDGSYAYETIIQESLLVNNPLVMTEQGTDYQLPTQKIGDYALVVTDTQGRELSRVKFAIVGESQQALPKNAELTVKLNKPEFKAGETIDLQISAPYTGSGLITLEREKVYRFKWFKMDKASTLQTIQIPADFIGNGYINIMLIRDWNSEDIFMKPLSYAVIPFTVNRDIHQLKINLSAPSHVQSGNRLDIHYKTNQPAKVIIYAVDEGILQVTHYETPKPLDYFFRKQALTVTTQQTLDQILPKFILKRELSSIGGDALRTTIANYINPFKRKVDKPVVYWSGIVNADTVEKQVSYEIPDYFNGRLRLIAIGASDHQVGTSTQDVTVNSPFVINSNIPTFVSPGDQFIVSAGIANIQGGNTPLTIALSTSSGLEIIGSSTQVINIPEGSEKSLQFKLRAKQLGSADLKFTVKGVSKQNQITNQLSIRPASNYHVTFNTGYTQEKQKEIPVERELYTAFQHQQIAVSQSPLILVQGLHRYLELFPYNCTEQLVSKAFFLIAFANQPILNITSAQAQAKFNEIIQILRERHLPNGNFSYWPGGGETNATKFITIYVMHFLTEAKQLGYSIPNDLMDTGLTALKDIAAAEAQDKEMARLQAYAIYVLTRNEIVTTDYLTNLLLTLEKDNTIAWKQDIISAYIGATYQLLQKEDEANEFIKFYKFGAEKIEMNNDFYKPMNMDAQYIILLAKHFPQFLTQIKEKDFFNNLFHVLTKTQVDTLSAAYASLALKAYDENMTQKENRGLGISAITMNNQHIVLATEEQNKPMISLTNSIKKLFITNPHRKPYFYLLTQAGYDKHPIDKIIKNGIEIYREYQEGENNAIKETQLGHEITVHIKVRALNKKYISNVAIEDLLPGGFEVVRESVKRDQVDYVDIREDKVIFFTDLNEQAKEIVYTIKAVNSGQYTIPPITAKSMYDNLIYGQGITSRIVIK
ncbi:MAG: hypothetical protein LEGION0398_MBIBDBAK_00309 [Legionellaceae bacterium]